MLSTIRYPLSVQGPFRECEGDRDIEVAKRLFSAYNFIMNGPIFSHVFRHW